MAPPDELEQRTQDRALAKGLAAGKPRAWDAFFTLYGAPLYRFVLFRGRLDPTRADDVAQDVIVAALESIGRYDWRKGNLWNWLCGIAVNKLREAARNDSRESRLQEALGNEPMAHAQPDGQAGANVMATLWQLHPRHQEILALKYMESLPVRDIAQRLSITEKAAESRLSRGREAFRAAYTSLPTRDDDDDG